MVEGIPVFPVFAAEYGANSKLRPFQMQIDFPDVPHQRDTDAQRLLDKLLYVFT